MRRTSGAGLLLTLALACAQRCVGQESACETSGTLIECAANVRAQGPSPTLCRVGLDLHPPVRCSGAAWCPSDMKEGTPRRDWQCMVVW